MMLLLKVEWLRLRRRVSVWAILFVFFIAGLAAIFLGQHGYEAQMQEVAGIGGQFHEQCQRLEHRYKKAGEHSGYWAYYSAFPVAQKPQPLAALSWGLRGVAPSVIWVRLLGLEQQLYETEMANPQIQSLGQFDLGFVFSVLAPLVLLLLCHDVLSRDRSDGTLPLLAAQAGGLGKIFFVRLLLRFVLLVAVCVFLFLAAGVILELPRSSETWVWLGVALIGLLPWALIVAVIAARARSVGTSLMAAMACFVGFMVLLPALFQLSLSVAFPVAEGLELTVRQRQVMHDGWDQARQLNYEKFLSERAQYAEFPTVPEDTFSWRWYYAMHEVADRSVKKLSQQYIASLRQRQLWSQRLAWISPPAMTQAMLCSHAATDLEAYLRHLDQTRAFHEDLKDYFFPLIFAETVFASGATQGFPQFRPNQAPRVSLNFLPSFLLSLILLPFARPRLPLS